MEKTFLAENVIEALVRMDELRPHLHATVVPILLKESIEEGSFARTDRMVRLWIERF